MEGRISPRPSRSTNCSATTCWSSVSCSRSASSSSSSDRSDRDSPDSLNDLLTRTVVASAAEARSGMEHLWSRADATDGNRRQTHQPCIPHDHLLSSANNCPHLPRMLDGKEGVDGSSPSEGSVKAPHVGAFAFRPTCPSSRVRWVWSRLWSFRVDEPYQRGMEFPQLSESLPQGAH